MFHRDVRVQKVGCVAPRAPLYSEVRLKILALVVCVAILNMAGNPRLDWSNAHSMNLKPGEVKILSRGRAHR
jgi:hypothetical protein